MHFTIRCTDKPGSLDLRLATRPDHLAYLQRNVEKLVLVGPVLDEEGRPKGSFYVVEVADRAEAERLAAEDPYAKAGLFARVEIDPVRVVFKDGAQVAG
ncbi:YciI family protein [Elioraea thermophila]|uniref:YciI family protein n=1 Tax=Elioraea thermophila TaxID=2185104 RepID=UPI000DF3EA06|nr:YciI family protein [Elioraea thermophila]